MTWPAITDRPAALCRARVLGWLFGLNRLEEAAIGLIEQGVPVVPGSGLHGKTNDVERFAELQQRHDCAGVRNGPNGGISS